MFGLLLTREPSSLRVNPTHTTEPTARKRTHAITIIVTPTPRVLLHMPRGWLANCEWFNKGPFCPQLLQTVLEGKPFLVRRLREASFIYPFTHTLSRHGPCRAIPRSLARRAAPALLRLLSPQRSWQRVHQGPIRLHSARAPLNPDQKPSGVSCPGDSDSRQSYGSCGTLRRSTRQNEPSRVSPPPARLHRQRQSMAASVASTPLRTSSAGGN
jgi:hypothetical protein